MANTLVTPTWVMKEVGRRLVNNIKFANNVNRSYSDEFVQAGAKVGYTVNARMPQRYKVSKGQALTITSVTDTVVPITLTDQANVGLEFSMASLTMEVDNYKKRYIDPAVDALVNQLDYDGLSRMYQSVHMYAGTPDTAWSGGVGTTTHPNVPYLDAGVKLSQAGVPSDGRVAILSPSQHAILANANVALFNPSGQISEAFRSGQFGREALGVSEWFNSQNVANHTVGALGGTPAVHTTNPVDGATSVSTDGWSSTITGALKKGDVIQFNTVYAVNPMNYQSTGELADFVVTADVDVATSAATVYFSPALQSTGPFQNITELPVDGDVITIFGHASSYAAKVTPQALIYHPDAFAMVMADLELPSGLWVAERISNKALGIAIRFLKDYSITTDQSPARLDLLYGWKAVRPELACRVCG